MGRTRHPPFPPPPPCRLCRSLQPSCPLPQSSPGPQTLPESPPWSPESCFHSVCPQYRHFHSTYPSNRSFSSVGRSDHDCPHSSQRRLKYWKTDTPMTPTPSPRNSNQSPLIGQITSVTESLVGGTRRCKGKRRPPRRGPDWREPATPDWDICWPTPQHRSVCDNRDP